MPELAEVQTLANQLDAALSGTRIQKVEVLHEKLWKCGSVENLQGQNLHRVDRWGKRLRFYYGHRPGWLVVSLGMTGGWGLGQDQPQHAGLMLGTEGGRAWYTDPRRFGSFYLFESEREALHTLGSRIGQDAAAQMTANQMQEVLGGGKIVLKAALLDQSRLAGIGNYLADEIAWQAKVSPRRPLAQILDREWQALNQARAEIIGRALRYGGLSFSDYLHLDGRGGSMGEYLCAYGRAGKPCLRCNTIMQKTRVAGRGTHYCPQCQA